MQERDVIILAGLEQLIDFFESQARQFADAGAPVEIEGPCSFFDLYTYFRVMPAGEHDWCRAARVELIEQSDGCLRLWFRMGYFPDHDLFWRVVDGLVGGIKQHGFHILEPMKTRDTKGGIASQEGETVEKDAVDGGGAVERLPHPDVRERRDKVKRLWVRGLTDADIARSLTISESTVKRDRRHLGLRTKS